MRKKIKHGLIELLLIVISTNLYSQLEFIISADHSYQINGNEFTLFSETFFPFGYGSSCPSLDTFIVSTACNVVSIDLIFDVRGIWPQAGCTSYDTTTVFIDTNFNAIIVNLKIIDHIYDSFSINDSVIKTAQTDTLVQNLLSSVETFSEYIINVFPNPAREILQLDYSGESKIEKIELFDIKGKKIKVFGSDEMMLNISEIRTSTYFLKITTSEGILAKKVVIE